MCLILKSVDERTRIAKWINDALWDLFLFCSEARPMQVALETGHVVDLLQRTSQVVCFSSRQRDHQALCQAVLPTVYRQDNPPHAL